MDKRKLVFWKAIPDAPTPDANDDSSRAERSGSFADIFGALKDTVTISPGTNLTDPIDEDWNAARRCQSASASNRSSSPGESTM